MTTLTCELLEVTVTVPPEDEVQKRLAATRGTISTPLTDLKVEACRRSGAMDVTGRPVGEMSPEQRRWFELQRSRDREVCKCSDHECAEDAIQRWEEAYHRACRVFARSWKTTLQRTASTTWSSRSGPIGPCGTVEEDTLERTGNTERGWKFSRVRVLTNGTACPGLPPETPDVWSATGQVGLVADCPGLALTQY